MPTLTIDGKQVTVEAGTTILQAAKQVGFEVPHFCYHPKLSIAGNCRMCLVEIEGSPKPVIACSATVSEGMMVKTQSEMAKSLQKNTLEFILINHPIDCPICDQAGECKLQNYYMSHSLGSSEFIEEKNHKPKKVDLGPYVVLDDERCILCTRCVRFCDEITKTGELGVINRGDRSTLTTFPGRPLDNKYSLNTVEICPVGALTNKDFRFQCRVWFLKTTPSICTGCATGCNIFINHHEGRVYRYTTRENEVVNECWTCDEGRLSYKSNHESRVRQVLVKDAGALSVSASSVAIAKIAALVQKLGPDKISFIASASESNENNAAFKKLAGALGVTDLQYSSREVADPYSDNFLIKADKNPNRQGVTNLGFKPFTGGLQSKIVFVLDSLSSSHLEKIKSESPKLLVLIASNESVSLDVADIVLPSLTFAEQQGSFINFQNRIQKFAPALTPLVPAQAAWQWVEQIASALGHIWKLGSSEKLLQEFFKLTYAGIGEGGVERKM